MKNSLIFNPNHKHQKNKKIYFFGSGDIASKTLRNIKKTTKVLGTFDNKKSLQGIITRDNLEIFNPKLIKKINISKIHIIITTSSYDQVIKQLKTYKLKQGTHYTISHRLEGQNILDTIQNHKCSLSFASATFKQNKKDAGGGIYNLYLNGTKWKVEKKLSGPCYCIIRVKNNYIISMAEKGILICDLKFNILKQKKIDKSIRFHGISYSKKFESYFVTCTNRDKIIMFDKDLNSIKKEFYLSNKSNSEDISHYHCNDCFVRGNFLFVSVFSVSGKYKSDTFDGGIIKFDIRTGKKISVIKNDLLMPHNIVYLNNQMHVIDSLRGNLLYDNFSNKATFLGFSRGIDYHNGYYFIGQSRNRQASKIKSVNNNVSADTGIMIFDKKNKISRFLNVNNKISEIHSILVHK